MKKTIAFLTSLAALCSLISCEENEIEDIKGDSEVIQEETVQTETHTEADLPFREYKAEDFTDIKVKLTMQQTAPPVKVEEYDLSWIEFEPKVPLCALPENRSIEKFMPYYESDAENYDMTPEEYAEEYMKLYEPLLDKPVYPSIECITSDGENIYYVAKYDKCCNYKAHDFEIYRCNPETKENECIFTYSDTDVSFSVYDMAYYNSELWIIGEYDKSRDNVIHYGDRISAEGCNNSDESSDEPLEGIFRADKETNTLELVFWTDDNSTMQMFYQTDEKRLISSFVTFGNTENELKFYEYKGNAWEEIHSLENNTCILLNDDFVTSYEKNKSLFTECSRFTLDTGLRSAYLAAISDNRATYLLKDSLSTILYTYDFEKMERYIIDLTSYGREYGYYGAGDNILLHQPAGKSGMYIIPELGAAFEIFRADFEPGMDYRSGEVYISHNICNVNGKIAVIEKGTVNRTHLINGDISANIPDEEYYIGKDKSRINKVYFLGE
ncbi:MAG: hypothetical protein IKJ60_03355 [Ruminococcus sp.]|nr:hypothetical protein [Ruminococcus sp.]